MDQRNGREAREGARCRDKGEKPGGGSTALATSDAEAAGHPDAPLLMVITMTTTTMNLCLSFVLYIKIDSEGIMGVGAKLNF